MAGAAEAVALPLKEAFGACTVTTSLVMIALALVGSMMPAPKVEHDRHAVN